MRVYQVGSILFGAKADENGEAPVVFSKQPGDPARQHWRYQSRIGAEVADQYAAGVRCQSRAGCSGVFTRSLERHVAGDGQPLRLAIANGTEALLPGRSADINSLGSVRHQG